MSFDLGVGDLELEMAKKAVREEVEKYEKLSARYGDPSCSLFDPLADPYSVEHLKEIKEKYQALRQKKEAARNEITRGWKTCPASFAPLNTEGTCVIDSIVFAFLYPPLVRATFMQKVYKRNNAEYTKFCESVKKAIETPLGQEKDGESASPQCLNDFVHEIVRANGGVHSTKNFEGVMQDFLTTFTIPCYNSLEHLREDWTPAALAEELSSVNVLVLKHFKGPPKADPVYLGLLINVNDEEFKLRSVVIDKAPAKDTPYRYGHAMALSSCSDLGVFDTQWHFYNGQTANSFAQGPYSIFADSFLEDFRHRESSEIPFGVAYQGKALNVYDEDVCAYLVYVRSSR